MALFQKFPSFEAKVKSAVDKHAVVDIQPEVVSFIAGSNLRVISDRILEHKFVQIDAAPGAGKSTVLPKFLVQQGLLVIHVLPYVQLAAITCRRYEEINGKASATFISDVTSEWPDCGYVVTYAGCLAAKWLSVGEVSLPKCVLLQDESHESDAASAIIRDLVALSEDLISYVRMSATSDPMHYRNGRLPGQVIEREYAKEAFDDPWTVADARAPWSVAAVRHFSIVFEDDDTRATDLMQAYGLHGVVVFRWCKDTPVDLFLSDYKMINDNPDDKFVVIADSTYRSGYTFDVDTIIDSGVVTRKVVDRGHVRYHSRAIREFELVQTRARGGRISGLRTLYWRPMEHHENVLCTLEQTDVEAYVLMCNLLNVQVPDKYAKAKMNRGLVPKDVCAALNDGTPLAAIPDSCLAKFDEFVETGDGRFAPAIEVAEVREKEGKKASHSRRELFEFVNCVKDDEDAVTQEPMQSNLLICNANLEDLSKKVEACFPRGFATLAQYYHSANLDDLIAVLPFDEALQVLQMAIDKHNSALLTVRSIDLGLQESRECVGSVEPKVLKKWVIHYTEKMVLACSAAELAMKISIAIAKILHYQLRQCECDQSDLQTVKVKMKEEISCMPRMLSEEEKTRMNGRSLGYEKSSNYVGRLDW